MMTIAIALLVFIHSEFKSYTRLCNNHDYCGVKMYETHNEIFKSNKYQRSMKIPFIIYTDTESLLEKEYTHGKTIQENCSHQK